jgi:hypothetical protein
MATAMDLWLWSTLRPADEIATSAWRSLQIRVRSAELNIVRLETNIYA